MPAYIIFARDVTTDQAEMDIYSPLARASMAGHPIKPLSVYGDFQSLEGQPIEGAVVLEFPTIAEARAWYDSPAYQEALVHRKAGADYRVFITDGLG